MNIIPNTRKTGYICPQCKKDLPYVKPPFCLRCGKHIEAEDQEYCSDCKKRPKSFCQGFPVFAYEGKIKDSVLMFKYKNKREFAQYYAGEIITHYGNVLKTLGLDGVIPVPVHASRYRRRGYNQAELLASVLAKELSLPIYASELIRTENTHVQKELNDSERYANLKNAFKRRQDGVKLKKVLLVDDIYTSGATIEACTHVLKKTGVDQVYYTSICIGQGI